MDEDIRLFDPEKFLHAYLVRTDTDEAVIREGIRPEIDFLDEPAARKLHAALEDFLGWRPLPEPPEDA